MIPPLLGLDSRRTQSKEEPVGEEDMTSSWQSKMIPLLLTFPFNALEGLNLLILPIQWEKNKRQTQVETKMRLKCGLSL